MNDEKLIEFVRLNPALYNIGNPKYLDTKYKNHLWEKIASELTLNEKDFNICKNRWTNIRDQYKKCLKNEKTVSKHKQAATTKKKYKYAYLLEFLKGCEDEIKDHSNFSFSKHNPVLTEKETTEEEWTDDIQAIDAPAHTFTKEEEDERSNDDMPLLPTPPSSHSIGKRKATPNVSASHTLMKYVIENNKKNKEENKPIHPIDAFLNGLAPTLKSLSPYNQHVAKGQIFRFVHDLEHQELFDPLSSPSSSSISLHAPKRKK